MLVVRLFAWLGLVMLGAGCPRPPLEEQDGGGSNDASGTVGTGSSSDGPGLDGDETGVAQWCGNGIVEAGEACDGDDLAGGTCEVLGYEAGTLGCDAECRYDESACEAPPEEPPEEPALQLGFSQVKRFDFSWAAVPGAEHYQLLERAAPGEPFVPLGGDLVGTSASFEMPLHLRWQASYLLRACDADGCTDTAEVDVVGSLAEAVGYVKASNSEEEEEFGYSMALSGDGNTLAVGAYSEDSNATGIGGNQADNSATSSGAVYVFVREGAGTWSQQGYIKASNTGEYDQFGRSVALSEDGNTLAVGAPEEHSSATGIDGDQGDNGAQSAGAAYVFVRDPAGMWSQQAYVKASNAGWSDRFGGSVALSGDGDTMAVGAYTENSSATGIDGDQGDVPYSPDFGAAYVFVRDPAGIWSQQAYVKASNTGAGDHFGYRVALSGDGDTLAVGAPDEDSNATGIGGNQADNSATDSGAVYVFVRDGAGAWSQQAYVKASSVGLTAYFGPTVDAFGTSVTLSGDGDTLAVGAPGEDSNATGIDGDQADDSAPQAGAVYVFVRDGAGAWSQQAYVKASNTDGQDSFGRSVALSGDGDTLAVGAPFEDSTATGIGGNQANDFNSSGAVYLLVRDGAGAWSQQAYVKASNTDGQDSFGSGVALSADGHVLAVAAEGEASNATGIGGDQTNDSAPFSGGVYLY